MASKPLKLHRIVHEGHQIYIETEYPKNKTIMAILRLLVREVMRTKPELWNEFLDRLNNIQLESKIEEEEDFDFFESLMSKTHS